MKRAASLTVWSWCLMVASFVALCQWTDAYRVSGRTNVSEPAVCRDFITRIGKEGFQMRAYSMKNSSDEWYTASEVNQRCDGSMMEVDAFVVLMTKFPTRIGYTLTLPKANDVKYVGQYRVNVIASWGDITDNMRSICDYDGNAYFVAPDGLLATGAFFPQDITSKDWTMQDELVVSSAFALDLHGKEDSAPVFGEGFMITPVVCRVRPSPGDAQQRVFPKRNNLYLASMTVELRHWWGWLHPEMWSELILLATIALPKFLLVVWFAYRCRVFRDHVLTQQKYFLRISVFSFLASAVFMLFLLGANSSGADTCCPTPPLAALFWGLKVMSGMLFDLLVLATAKGWGVVTPKLESTDQRKIILYFVGSMVIYSLSQVLQPSLSLAWLVVISETGIWVWTFICLKQTKQDLTASSRLDRHAKIDMYQKLYRLLLSGLGLWTLIVTIEIWVVLIIFNRDGRIVLFDIPPTLAWDMALLLMMWGFGWVWQPSPATAQFSYAFARQEEDGVDTRDPVGDFGLETT